MQKKGKWKLKQKHISAAKYVLLNEFKMKQYVDEIK